MDYLSEIVKNTSDIHNSIIIVDTCNLKFSRDNRVISISSPDNNNNLYYIIDDYDIDLYFESLKFDEIQKWYENCLGFGENVESNDFKDVC